MGHWVFDLAFFHEAPWGVGYPILKFLQFRTSSTSVNGALVPTS
jgi:hypothetical protein